MTETVHAPLTYGQLSVWRSIEHLPLDTTEANLTRTWDLPEGTDVAAVRAALDALEARHESLRTTYAFRGERGIEQVVRPPAGVDVPVVDVDGLAPPGSGAKPLAARGFALDREPAWRVALHAVDGRPVRLAVCIHHMVADSVGIGILHDELLGLLAGKTLADDPPTPREIAAEQHSGAWDARTQGAVAYWRRCVADGPAGEQAPDAATDICWADFFSIPALEAARDLAAGLNVSLQTVVFSAFCQAVAVRDGRTDIVVGQVSGNRTDARSRRLVSTVVQLVPVRVVLDPGDDFPDLAKRLQWSTLAAYRHGYFDVDALRDLEAEFGHNAAGAGFRYFFNFSDAFQAVDPGDVALGDDGWTIDFRDTGRDNGFRMYFVGTAGPMLQCTLRERSDEPRSAVTAERLTARTREFLVAFHDILRREAAQV